MVVLEIEGVDWDDVHAAMLLTGTVSETLEAGGHLSFVTYTDIDSRAGSQGDAMVRGRGKCRQRRLLLGMLLGMDDLKPGCPQPTMMLGLNTTIKLTSTCISLYRIGSCSWIGRRKTLSRRVHHPSQSTKAKKGLYRMRVWSLSSRRGSKAQSSH